MIPQNINNEHLVKAIEDIERDCIRIGRHSSTYNLIHNFKVPTTYIPHRNAPNTECKYIGKTKKLN